MTDFERAIEDKFKCDCKPIGGHSPSCLAVISSQVLLEMKKEAIRGYIIARPGYSEFIMEISKFVK